MKHFKNICTLALCVLLTFSLAIPAFAADSTVTYRGRNDGFIFAPGSTYVASDLFDAFKDVMPGDTKTETVTFVNESKGSDYVNVYLGVLFHDSENNPISPTVLEALSADERRGTMSELEYMHDFLNQLELRVWNGEKTDEKLIFAGKPDSLEDGFEEGSVFLGSLSRGKSLEFLIELAVDIEMGNEFADRIGEVDWVFVIEERNHDSDSDDSDGGGSRPGNKPDVTDKPVDVVVPIEPENGGIVIPFLPKTGDETVIWPFVVGGLLALVGLIVLVCGKRKENE